MRIDKRLTIVGIMLIVLSMTMATQYATTKVAYTYTIVHPSNADIRFIGSDNSTDHKLVLRVSGDNSSGNRALQLKLGGNWTENFNKTYTAAFGIVNEENFTVDITHINVSTLGGTSDYLQIWLHGDRDALAVNDATSVMVWNKATMGFDSTTTVWQLGAGDGDPEDMDTLSGGIPTPWEDTTHVRYSISDVDAVNGTDDYVWIQVSMDIPEGAAAGTYSGLIWVHYKADTT